MAAEFLASHGIDLDAELSRLQSGAASTVAEAFSSSPSKFSSDADITLHNVSLPHSTLGSRWNLIISPTLGNITKITPHDPSSSSNPSTISAHGALLTPSLCNPHLHLDKPYLLSHPSHSSSHRIQTGDFAEAMSLTTTSKSNFQHSDLLERGSRVLDESSEAGVTDLRAFVEVDAGVGVKCLDAGVELKAEFELMGRGNVQICAFAQLPLFSSSAGDEDGAVIRDLMTSAAARAEVEAVGSTPYVEDSPARTQRNVEWMVDLSISSQKHLDFHLDYNLDSSIEPVVWHVIRTLKAKDWLQRTGGTKTVVLGHCTRLTLFSPSEWRRLREEIGDLPVHFVGLPTSDLFILPPPAQANPTQTRGTLNVVEMIDEYGLNACLGVNNIGNAFTPYGTCDPLFLACLGVGVYQAGTEGKVERLFECVSTRARKAIGVGNEKEEKKVSDCSCQLREGSRADLLLFRSERVEWRTRKSVAEAVYLYDSAKGRRTFYGGCLVENSDG